MQRMAGGCSDTPLPSACSEVSLTGMEPMDRCEGNEMDWKRKRKDICNVGVSVKQGLT